jgi:hypothetical protein
MQMGEYASGQTDKPGGATLSGSAGCLVVKRVGELANVFEHAPQGMCLDDA